MKKALTIATALGLLLQMAVLRGAEAHEPTCYNSGNARHCVHEDHANDDAVLGALLVVGVVAAVVVVAVIASGEEKKTPVSTNSLFDEAEPDRTSLQPFYDMEQRILGVEFRMQF